MGISSYLALAGIIAAGAKGIMDRASLKVKDLSTASAAEISPEERAALGIKDRMSLSAEEARQRFKDDPLLREWLGEDVVDAYLSVNKVGPFSKQQVNRLGSASFMLQTATELAEGVPEASRKFYIEHW
jgi:glutamine synthetase